MDKPSIWDYLLLDFAHCAKLEHDEPALTITTREGTLVSKVSVVALIDVRSRSRYLAYKLPADFDFRNIIKMVTDSENILNDVMRGTIMDSGYLTDPVMNGTQLVFTKLVYFYIDSYIDPEIAKQLFSRTSPLGFHAVIRDLHYRDEKAKLGVVAGFVSYDNVDRTGIVEPLVMELSKQGCKVWFDKYELNVGDSLRQRIEDGIKECHKCILVLSPSFLANTRYAINEFDAWFTKERIQGGKVFLPIWAGVDRAQVFAYSPSLADRYAYQWNEDPARAARALAAVLVPAAQERISWAAGPVQEMTEEEIARRRAEAP